MNDYVFWSRKGDVLATETWPANEAEARARELARQYKTAVGYAIVLDHSVEPVFCVGCGEPMPENGPCNCSLFEEEETHRLTLTSCPIPFLGER
jgi:hypothetical protein